MITSEDVLFIMPRDRELQFAAMSGLQSWVNDYQLKMQANCVTAEMPSYRFRYRVDMPEDDWRFFQRLGLELKQQPEEIAFPDAVIDLSDARLLAFYNSEKHCGQVVSALCGVEAQPLPKCRRIECGMWNRHLVWVGAGRFPSELCAMEAVLYSVDVEELIGGGYADGALVMGLQSPETYAAATLGLPVIEILQPARSVNWLSKFKNPLYRLIEENKLTRLPDAIASIEATLQWIVERRRCNSSQVPAGMDAIRTAPIALSAPTASST